MYGGKFAKLIVQPRVPERETGTKSRNYSELLGTAKLEISIKISDKEKGSKNTKLVPVNDALTKP